MSEAGSKRPDWISAWIAEQREHLQRMSAAASPASTPFPGQIQDLGARWLDVAQSYMRGMAHFDQSGPDAGARASASSKFNEELLQAWQGAWAGVNSAGEQANQHFSGLLARLPPLGLAREHTEAWRELAAAQRECQELEQALRVELARMQNAALALLEQRLRERDLANKPVAAWRELYDLWVECGEQAFSQVAHSDAYSKLQAELGNATVRLRARQQSILEYALRQFDLPTRSELNTVHRQLRELRETVAALEAQLAPAPSSGSRP